MTGWLSTTDTEDWPAGFSVERECELKSHDEEKSVVRYTRHHLLNDEVRLHLQQGKRPTRLAMSWEGRMAFTLTESMQLRKLTFLEGVFDDRAQDDEKGFDTDVALATGELQKLIPALIEALGGELAPGEFPTAPAPAEVTLSAAVPVTATTADDDGPPF
jgi:recombination associated protein RdgC